jgi:hypothetical protein
MKRQPFSIYYEKFALAEFVDELKRQILKDSKA